MGCRHERLTLQTCTDGAAQAAGTHLPRAHDSPEGVWYAPTVPRGCVVRRHVGLTLVIHTDGALQAAGV